MKRRGRPSNWDGILAAIGLQTWKAMCSAGCVDDEPSQQTPDPEALQRLARAAMHATGNAKKKSDKAKVGRLTEVFKSSAAASAR
jgi:hypothetical protein